MIKLKLFLFLYLSSSFLAFSQVKESIVIIKPKYNSKIIDTFNKESEKYKKEDREKLSETFKNFTNGGHGSGFVISDENGDQYVITNKHVVQFAESITIIIEDENNEKIEYNDAEIIYIDRTIDLALIKLNSNSFKSTFNLSLENLKDGQEVWAAGYPGLLGEPAWQFSKGNITNKNASIPTIESSDLSFLIQHSATIDPGNSGGPLLIKDDNEEIKYSVIGINTWSISNRNNTFFSIPSLTIDEFFNKGIKNYSYIDDSLEIEKQLLTSIDDFVNELNSDEPNQKKISSYISPGFIGKQGLDSYQHVIETSSSSLRSKWRNSFFNYSPISTMRGAIYERLMTIQDSEHETEFIKLLSIEQSPNWVAKTQFKMDGKTVKLGWVYNHGLWQIEDMKLNKLSIEKKKDLVDKGSHISPAYMNFALPGLTQTQRDYTGGAYLIISAACGYILILDSVLNHSDTHTSNSRSGFSRETEFLTGLTFYASSALISFVWEKLTK